MTRYGLDKYRVKNMLEDVFRTEPDLFYYIDNQYIERLVNVLTDGIANVIEENNKKIIDDIIRDLHRR